MPKRLLCALLGLLAVAGLTACGSSGNSNGSLTVSENQTGGENCNMKPVKGGSLVYARQLETVSLNPLDWKNGNGDIFADEMIYTGLVRSDPTGPARIVPSLAERWKMSNGGKTYTFYLRPGLKFSNGEPLDAENVVWNMERFINPEDNTQMSAVSLGIKDVEELNKTTVRINLSEPIAAFLYNISIYPAFILPEHAVEKEGAAFFNDPVSSGPFQVKQWNKGQSITFERNPYWFESDKPYLETVRWNFVTNSNTRLLALKSGEAQMADGIPFSQAESVQSDPNLVLQKIDLPQYLVVSQNTKTPALSDLHVRKAISLALNRDQINEVVFKGLGVVPNSILPPFELDASKKEIAPAQFDLAAAKKEMAASKYPQGFSITMQYPAGLDDFKQVSLLMQQQLSEIGVELKLEELEAGTIAERWVSGEYEMDIPFPGTTSDIPVPDEYATIYALNSADQNGFETFWHDDQLEAQVKEFLRILDPAKREKAWHALQEAFNEQAPTLNVLDIPFLNAHQADVCGTYTNANGVDQLQETWIAK